MSGLVASIIITNYNYGRFLREAIESALGQSYRSTEVIVVDDGSTDDSPEIIAGYGSKIIPVIKRNGGMGSTYNAGFAASHGDVIFFLDADDTLVATTAERVVGLFDQPGIAKAHWPLWEVDSAGSRSGRLLPDGVLPEGDLLEAIVEDGPEGYLSPSTTGNAWARSFLERVLPVPEVEFRQHADGYLITLAPLFGRVRRLQEPQGCYRMHGGNDFACRPTDEKVRRLLRMYEERCAVLSGFLRYRGVEVDPIRWKNGNAHYAWLESMHLASSEIKDIIPAGASFILVDEGGWGGWAGGTEVITGRRAIPFLECDGQYWGAPSDDATAIRELERLRASGADFIVFVWDVFWWLQHYDGLAAYLRSRYLCIAQNERVVVFDLRVTGETVTRAANSRADETRAARGASADGV